MSENEKPWFVDPNSGAAPQPGGVASMPAVKEEAPAEVVLEETLIEETPEVLDDNEAPAGEGDSTEEETPEKESTEESEEEESTETVETSIPGSLNPRMGTPAPEPEPEVEAEVEAEDFSEVLAGNIPSIQKFLEENPEKREALVAAERAGKNRSGIVEG